MTDPALYPVPNDAHRLLLFGGTFDPPHRAHIELPLAARDAIDAEWLLYIPAGRSPHKKHNPAASNTDRLAMLEAALHDIERTSVSAIECPTHTDDSPRPPSFTVDTLERLADLAGPTQLRLLIGADQAASFHLWREPRRIIELAEPVVMLRAPNDDRDTLLHTLADHWHAAETARWADRIVNVPLIDVSATRIRRLLGAGARQDPELTDMLPEPVLTIIRDRDLYSASD